MSADESARELTQFLNDCTQKVSVAFCLDTTTHRLIVSPMSGKEGLFTLQCTCGFWRFEAPAGAEINPLEITSQVIEHMRMEVAQA